MLGAAILRKGGKLKVAPQSSAVANAVKDAGKQANNHMTHPCGRNFALHDRCCNGKDTNMLGLVPNKQSKPCLRVRSSATFAHEHSCWSVILQALGQVLHDS